MGGYLAGGVDEGEHADLGLEEPDVAGGGLEHLGGAVHPGGAGDEARELRRLAADPPPPLPRRRALHGLVVVVVVAAPVVVVVVARRGAALLRLRRTGSPHEHRVRQLPSLLLHRWQRRRRGHEASHQLRRRRREGSTGAAERPAVDDDAAFARPLVGAGERGEDVVEGSGAVGGRVVGEAEQRVGDDVVAHHAAAVAAAAEEEAVEVEHRGGCRAADAEPCRRRGHRGRAARGGETRRLRALSLTLAAAADASRARVGGETSGGGGCRGTWGCGGYKLGGFLTAWKRIQGRGLITN